MQTKAKLYIVATPIGDLGDITLRALETLRSADAVICEEHRPGSTLLKRLGIEGKELITLNEHNEVEKVPEIVKQMLVESLTLAVISDCGTPVFADPGHSLIRQASEFNIPVIPVPGPSSLMAAMSVLDFKLEQFIFGGFLPRDPEKRRQELFRMNKLRIPVILMDTPYRMVKVLEDVGRVFGKNRRITLACDMTLKSETIYRDTVDKVSQRVGKRKAEFILIVHA